MDRKIPIKSLGDLKSVTPATKKGRSRSALYRKYKGKRLLQVLFLREANQQFRRDQERFHKEGMAAIEWLNQKPPDVSASKWLVFRDDEQYMRRRRAEVANAAKTKLSDKKLEKALALRAKGMKWNQIAVELGMTDKGLYKLRNRRK